MAKLEIPTDWRVSYKPYLIVDSLSWIVVDANYSAEEFWGYGPTRLANLSLAELLDDVGVSRIEQRARRAEGRAFSLRTLTMRQPSTAVHAIDLYATPFAATSQGHRWMLRFKEARSRTVEFEVGRVYWARSAYSRSMAALLTAETPAEVMSRVCDAIVVQEPYIIACVGLKQFDERKSVLIAARAGPARSYLHDIRLSWSDQFVGGTGATGRALRSGVPVIVRDAMAENIFAPWRERGAPYGIRSTVTVPFRREGEIAGALLIYANTPNAFGPRELSVFVQLGLEISFAMTFHENRRQLASAISARRAVEQHLEQVRAELRRSERNSFVGEFSAALAHEINQPLASIRTNADASLRWLARAEPSLEEAKGAIGRAIANTDRVADVITRIKRMYTDDPVPHAKVDIVEAVQDVIDIARERIDEKKIDIEEAYSKDPLQVDGDRLQLQQVVFNLISNAIDALEAVTEGLRKITVCVRPQGKGDALVEVRDSALGVDPEIRDRLFTRFVSNKRKGMGLGLMISKSIIEAHEGEIWAAPAEPRGTIFSLRIPLAREVGHA